VSGASPSFVTVSISSSPSRIEAETPSQVLFEAPSEVAKKRLGLAGVVHLPGLPQCASHLGVHRFRQAVQDVARLVYLAALNGRVASEGRADCLGESLRAVDDEEVRHSGIEAAFDEIADQRLHGRRVFRCTLHDARADACRRSHRRRSPPPGSCPRPCECRRSG